MPLGSLVDAAKLFGASAATIRRVDLKTAVAEFNTEREAKTKAVDGKRAALSARMAYQDKLRLNRFACATKRVDVCELSPDTFDVFFSKHTTGLSPKTRNHFRSTLSVFLKWSVRKGYLNESHTLHRSNWLFPDGNAKEPTEAGEVAAYSANEFNALLTTAKGNLQALIAIGGLAGLRSGELLRLSWQDVWQRPGFIKVTAQKAKTRSRRLVPIVPALAAWLEPFRECTEGRLWAGKSVSFDENVLKVFQAAGITRRRNALRHSFISYRLALVRNEHQVAAEAGTSVQMIHQHYRELVTPEEAEGYFKVQPATVDNVVALSAHTIP